MKISIVFSCLFAVAYAFPQGLQGTLSQDLHQLPESFFPSNVAVAPAEGSQGGSADGNKSGEKPASVSGESAPDSYANIGGASGGIASALTATNEYGETVPPAFSSLKEDTYAYYQGQNHE